MWNRKVIKAKAKSRLSVNYWKMVLVGLVLTLFSGGMAMNFNFNSDDMSTLFDGDDGFYYEYQFQNGETYHQMTIRDMQDMLHHGYGSLGRGAFGMFMAILVIIGLVVGIPLAIFVVNPLVLGGMRFFFKNIKEKADLKELGYAFDKNYLNQVKILFLRDLFTFLWSLLFVIPGIVKAYEYRMIPFLLAEDSSMSREEAFAISERMMTGNKWKTFVFDLSFIGWSFLTSITFGIVGIFYFSPYYYQASAMLYDAIKYDDGFRAKGEFVTDETLFTDETVFADETASVDDVDVF